MNQFVEQARGEYENVINHLKEELTTIRTGRASAALVENLMVEAYGAKTPLKQLAAISVSDSKTLIVQPWDKSILKEIEKSISQSSRDLGVFAEGAFLRLSLPALTEDKRKILCKLLNEKLEHSRIALRKIRDKVRENIGNKFKEKGLGEDEKFNFLEETDKATNDYNEKIKQMGEKKQAEIMTV